ncbi:MAG: squalene--hopene cyclase [Chthonomonadales bacterium]
MIAEPLTKIPGASRLDSVHPSADQIKAAMLDAQQWLLDQQKPDGHWVGELEGDTILETEYVLLLQFLGDPDKSKLQKLTNYVIRHWRNDDGGFPMFPGGPSDVSASVKAYFACKLAGHGPDEPFMSKLRECILNLGGVTRCNTFTKLYLSIFDQYEWAGVPTIPPEVFIVPNWFYFNIYEMSSWSRAILIPLAIINDARPQVIVPESAYIDELFVGGTSGKHLRLPWDPKKLSWKNAFLAADIALKVYDKRKNKTLRTKALKTAEKWLLDHQKDSGGLGAIFPAMTHAVMAYKCLGYEDSHPAVQHELRELARFEIQSGDEMRVQPCLSPVWDTAIAINSLIDSGLPAHHPSIRKGAEWLLAKQTTTKADWAVKTPNVEPGGWFFEYENEFYPDVDDTIMVLMALYKTYCMNGEPYTESPTRVRDAMQRGLDWTFGMQNKDGGWASFDRDTDKMLFQSIPFADHNAMLDPSTADITTRTLEMLSYFGFDQHDPRVKKAIAFVKKDQQSDGSWFGRWGVNYIYGTWQVLRGLNRIGYDMKRKTARRGVEWLKSVQNEDGGWGETCQSYDDSDQYKGMGPSTASQTSWALMGLINAGDSSSAEVQKGLAYLLKQQRSDGTWDEAWFTGTGFPKVFYLRYHLYRHYFPLWAMGQYMSVRAKHE